MPGAAQTNTFLVLHTTAGLVVEHLNRKRGLQCQLDGVS